MNKVTGQIYKKKKEKISRLILPPADTAQFEGRLSCLLELEAFVFLKDIWEPFDFPFFYVTYFGFISGPTLLYYF